MPLPGFRGRPLPAYRIGGLKGASGPLTSAKYGHVVSGQEYACDNVAYKGNDRHNPNRETVPDGRADHDAELS